MRKTIEKALDHVFNKLYYEPTGLIYDVLTSYENDGNICDLPTPEEIALQIPNPCGWNTGMEDSMISAGQVLEAVINCYEKTKDSNMKLYAKKLLKGIKLCIEVSGVRGFLARSVSPVDGKSYYFNSSRDQYTHCVYGLLKYYNSDMCDNEEKVWISKALVDFAERAHADITTENNYAILRSDCKESLVCTMFGDDVDCHESLRLHMIYMAAYVVSCDEKWYNYYKDIRDWGIEKAFLMNKRIEFTFLMQMQLSVRLLYDYESDDKYKLKYLELLEFVADKSDDTIIKYADSIDDYKESIEMLMPKWRDLNCWYMYGKPFGDMPYYRPEKPDDCWDGYKCLRQVANEIAIQAICPNRSVSDYQLKAFEKVLKSIDFSKYASHTVCHFIEAYWLL